jgi:hypothetical protein
MNIGVRGPSLKSRLFAGPEAGGRGRPSTEARSARKAAGRSAADSSVGDSGRSTLAWEGQYAQASVDAKRSAVSAPWASEPSGASAYLVELHQETPPSRAASTARSASLSRKKST